MAQSESTSEVKFETFFDEWLIHQRNLTDTLLHAISPENVNHQNEQQYQILIDQVLAHYQQLFEEKLRSTKEQVFLFFSPPWFSSFEKGFLWIGGFRPSLVFSILENSIKDLTPEDKSEIDRVRSEIRREERELGKTMAQLQESVASPSLMNVFRHSGKVSDGETSNMDSGTESIQAGMQAALHAADVLRGTTMRKILELLLPEQKIKLSAAIGQFQLRVRRWGQRESNNPPDFYGPRPSPIK